MPISDFLKKNALLTVELLLSSEELELEVTNCPGNFISLSKDWNENSIPKIPLEEIKHQGKSYIVYIKL